MKGDPIRLSEGTEPIDGVNPDLGSLIGGDLRSVRKAARPDYDVEAGLARFSALIGPGATGGAGLGGSGTIAAKTGATKVAVATGKGLLGVKWAVGVVAVMGAIGGTALVMRSGDMSPTATAIPTTTSTTTTPTTATTTSTATATTTPTTTSTTTPTTTSTSNEPSPPSTVIPSADARPSVKPEMDQMALLRQTADPARRLALADQGHAQFPKGVFWQEREVAAIGALAQLGRTPEAKARAQAFLARHPESPYREIVRGIADSP